jgi:hypothetical protein
LEVSGSLLSAILGSGELRKRGNCFGLVSVRIGARGLFGSCGDDVVKHGQTIGRKMLIWGWFGDQICLLFDFDRDIDPGFSVYQEKWYICMRYGLRYPNMTDNYS